MDIQSRTPGIEIDQDIRHEERSYKASLVFKVLWVLALAAAVLGFLGPGPFSSATTTDPSGKLKLEYNRFERAQSKIDLRLLVFTAAAEPGPIRVWIDRAYLDGSEVSELRPQPERAESSKDRLIFHFNRSAGSTVMPVRLILEPEAAGRLEGRIGVVNGPEIRFTQWIYP